MTKNIMLTGYWTPTHEMLRPFSPTNPNWIGKNWNNSGYDVYAYFSEFTTNNVGDGDFRVDFAATYNDFMRIVPTLNPIAMIGFGQGPFYWGIENAAPPTFQQYFKNGIPSTIGQTTGPVPDSLKTSKTYYQSLPDREIIAAVNALNIQLPYGPFYATLDKAKSGAGTYLCGFMSYLMNWYKAQHNRNTDPNYCAMAGFIHAQIPVNVAEAALDATLKAVIKNLP